MTVLVRVFAFKDPAIGNRFALFRVHIDPAGTPPVLQLQRPKQALLAGVARLVGFGLTDDSVGGFVDKRFLDMNRHRCSLLLSGALAQGLTRAPSWLARSRSDSLSTGLRRLGAVRLGSGGR